MKYYQCPVCKRVRTYHYCVLKICHCCQVEMEVKEAEEGKILSEVVENDQI